MAYGNIFHALGLHLYQPPGNLLTLLNYHEEEARQLIRCYDRITRHAHKYPESVKLHLCFSGTLLEQLRNPEVVDRCRHFMDIPAMLDSYRLAKNIEFLGSGYHHPIFPLIPTEDWEEQLVSERTLIEEVFGRAPKGFYPTEMAFTMRMIPALVKAGYEYVVIDTAPIRPHGEALDPFQTYRAFYNDVSITIVPKDSEACQAQSNGVEVYWFANTMSHRAGTSPRPESMRLLTTWSDVESSTWFHQEDHEGFFGKFLTPYMAHVRSRRYPIKPIFISDFIRDNPTELSAQVETCQWNQQEGSDLPLWQGSEIQRRALTKIQETSQRYCQLKKGHLSNDMTITLKKAYRLVLESESSYFLYGGDERVSKLLEQLAVAEKLLAEVESAMKVAEKGTPSTTPKPVADQSTVKGGPPSEVIPSQGTTPVKDTDLTSAKPTAQTVTPTKSDSSTKEVAQEVSSVPAKPASQTVVPTKSDSSTKEVAQEVNSAPVKTVSQTVTPTKSPSPTVEVSTNAVPKVESVTSREVPKSSGSNTPSTPSPTGKKKW